MRWIAVAATALALLFGAAASSQAKAPSFARWLSHFSAGVKRDITRISTACEKRYGHDDVKVGTCFVKAERVSLRAERARLRTQIPLISRRQKRACKRLIHRFWLASRTAANVNLAYLDSHRHASVTQLGRDLNGPRFTTLKHRTARAKARAVQVCK
ncbi:MAG: hypothetical protein QOH95_1614 [Gaiellaceae bacterium]|nr:hypothetical protein [Gaiellaceae bacterium]